MRISDWSSDVCSSDLAARAGIVMAPVGWRLSPAEWAFIVGDTRAKIVFTGPGFDGVAGQLAGRLDHGPKNVGADAARAMIAAAARAPISPAGRREAVLQPNTSGPNGQPNGKVDRDCGAAGERGSVHVVPWGARISKKKTYNTK